MEARNCKRINLKGSADLYDKHYNYMSNAKIHNVSEGGIGILTTHPMVSGEAIVLNLLEEENGKNIVIIKNIYSIILRAEKMLEGVWFHALMFTALDYKDRLTLKELCLQDFKFAT